MLLVRATLHDRAEDVPAYCSVLFFFSAEVEVNATYAYMHPSWPSKSKLPTSVQTQVPAAVTVGVPCTVHVRPSLPIAGQGQGNTTNTANSQGLGRLL